MQQWRHSFVDLSLIWMEVLGKQVNKWILTSVSRDKVRNSLCTNVIMERGDFELSLIPAVDITNILHWNFRYWCWFTHHPHSCDGYPSWYKLLPFPLSRVHPRGPHTTLYCRLHWKQWSFHAIPQGDEGGPAPRSTQGT